MQYTMPVRVRYSETNTKGFTDLHMILDYFQDSSIFHSESLGYSVKKELDIHRGWFLLAWDVEIDRFPSMGENLTIITEPYKMRGFYGYRRYMIEDEQGAIIAHADSLWLLMDLARMLPVKVPQEMTDAYIQDVHDDKIRVQRKLQESGEWQYKDTIEVNRHFLDSNQHVNNTFYALWAEELLPKDFIIKRVKIDYRQSAFDGDTIYISVVEEENHYRYRFSNQEDVLLALLDFEGK